MRDLRTIGRGLCAAMAVAGLIAPTFAAVCRTRPVESATPCNCCAMAHCGCCSKAAGGGSAASNDGSGRGRGEPRNDAKKGCSALCCATIVLVDRGSETAVGRLIQQRWQLPASVELPESLSSEGIFHPPRA